MRVPLIQLSSLPIMRIWQGRKRYERFCVKQQLTASLKKQGMASTSNPRFRGLALCLSHLKKIARKIAQRDRCEILPTGATAANIVGLSTQVPMNLSYITTGSTRAINVGDRKILFRHASPKNFAAKGNTIPLLVQALREIGEANISGAEYDAIKRFINKQQDPYLQEDLLLAPVWIQRIINNLI